MKRKTIAWLMSGAIILSTGAGNSILASETENTETATTLTATTEEEKAEIESALDLAQNESVTWTYNADNDAWVMSIVSAVAYPEIEEDQGVSVAVPGAYIKGIDTDGDGVEDITADTYTEEVAGTLVIDYEAEITSENGQVYTAATAPVIINTGAAGYSEQQNQLASTGNCANGYINVSCGNRGKQSTATDEDGSTYYTGDAPDCLVDQKNAIRFVKYNILLGNLPGSTEYFVSTGGSGGGAHAAMVAATSNNSDFYDYEIEQGAVGVYRNEDGSYSTTVTIDGTEYTISDGVWGTVAYSAITSLAEGDMTLAFEYNLDTDYSFNTDFQAALASYLSEEYMEYINAQNLTVEESAVGFDLNEDGDTEDTIDLTIEYDEEAYADTNGYGGTYLTLYLDEFISNLQWYVDNLDYAEDWTWFDEEGNALSDEEVAAMTSLDKAQAFIEGRYAKSSSSDGMMGGPGGPGGDMQMGDLPEMDGEMGELPDGGPDNAGGGQPGGGPGNVRGELPDGGPEDMAENSDGELPENEADVEDGEVPEDVTEIADGELPEDMANIEDGESIELPETASDDTSSESEEPVTSGMGDEVGTPDQGTTQASGSSTDSNNYSTYEEMVEAYAADIASVEAGDEYGNNQVDLYNPLLYIGDEDTESPVWTRIVMGASEGDMSMLASLNLQIAWLASGTDAVIEWQWDGGHVPSEIFGESLSLYIDEMYGKYVEGAVAVEKEEAETQTENGTAEEATGTDLSDWVTIDEDGNVSFTLADAAAYRTSGAAKAMPGFDVIDYGQETYEFGDSENDARHFDMYVLQVLQDYAEELSTLFNGGNS